MMYEGSKVYMDLKDYKAWKDAFKQQLKKDIKTYDKYPGHGANLMDLFDLFANDKS